MQDREEKREDVIRRKPCGRFRMRWKELAAAALLLLCFWGVFYPELRSLSRYAKGQTEALCKKRIMRES